MTILFFSAQYLPTVGGVERYTWNLALRTVRAGHRAVVVTSALPGLPDRETDPDGIEIIRLPVWPVMKGRFPVVRPAGAAALERAMEERKPDFCVIQTRMYTQSILAARAARRHGVPAIVIDHSTGYMPVGGGAVGLAGRLYEQLACGLIRRTGPDFYGVSAAVCRWLKTFGITAKGCLPNAVDPEALQREAAQRPMDWRTRLGLSADTRLVLFVGRLIPEKGAAALAEAVQGLPGTVLVAAGDGPDRSRLQELGAVAAGAVPHRMVVQLLNQADVYCLPTRYAEGFPTTLLEAAACGCPILCTPTAGTEELLPGPAYGTLLEDTSPQTIRAALKTLLDDPDTAREKARAARSNLCAHFTWDAVFARIMAIAQEKTKERAGD